MAERSTEPLFWDREIGPSSLTIEALDAHIQSYLADIVESCQTLYLAASSFSSYERSVSPEQIKLVRRSLKDMLKPTQEFSWLLRDTGRLPVIYMAFRYHLLAVINVVEDQISRLLELLHTYQVASISPSEGEKWLRREIYGMFEKLPRYTVQLSERVQAVRDDAKEQERELLSLYEDYPNWKGR